MSTVVDDRRRLLQTVHSREADAPRIAGDDEGTHLARPIAMVRFRVLLPLVSFAFVACSADTEGTVDHGAFPSTPDDATSAPSAPAKTPSGADVDASAPAPPPPPPPPATCDATAKAGEYCAGDKVEGGASGTLYRCEGPGEAKVAEVCKHGCYVATKDDDFCRAEIAACASSTLLVSGLSPRASDHLRCTGLDAGDISQTIGNAAASAGTHAADGTIAGKAYCAATDLRVSTLTDAEVRTLLDELAEHGFAAFFRDPGEDGWPASEARHVHAIYVGVPMKAALRAQVADWLGGRNGLASHTAYTFYQASPAKKLALEELFEKSN